MSSISPKKLPPQRGYAISVPIDIDEFVEQLNQRGGGVSPLTVSGYRDDLVRFARWFTSTTGELFVLSSVMAVDVRDYKAYLQRTRGLKPATINRSLGALKAFFSWAVFCGRVDSTPVLVKPVPEGPLAPRSIDDREYASLLRAARKLKKVRDVAILELLRHTGLRVGELCALTLADVIINERSGAVVVHSGKGNRYREVPLNKDARLALESYRKIRPVTVERSFFVGQRLNGLTPNGVQEILRKVAYFAKLPKVTPHTLRHTFAHSLANAGAAITVIQKLLGHARIDTTARYAAPRKEDLVSAVERLQTSE